MKKKIAGPLLLLAISLATIVAGTFPSLYDFSNAAQILTGVTAAVYDFGKSAQTARITDEADHPAPPWMANLTDTQKETLQQRMDELKAAGATREEIRTAIDELLTQWGIEIPQPPSECPQGGRSPPWMANLTDTQRAAVEQKMEELKAAGATREESRSAIDAMLTVWGIQVPSPPTDFRNPPWMENLTDTQKETLQGKMDELRAAGVTREEIRTAIDELLTQWGIEIPQPPGGLPAPQ